MLDASTNVINKHGSLITISTLVSGAKILGKDHRGDLFCTKVVAQPTTASATNWRQITVNSVTITCLTTCQFWTGTAWVAASSLSVGQGIYGLSGTTLYSFDLGGYTTHTTIESNYRSLYQSFNITANDPYTQTATAYGLKTSDGCYFAARFLVRDS